jgi:hypothetical protein
VDQPVGAAAIGILVLIHLVSFKYKSGVEEAARQDHRAKLKTLARLPGVIELKVGADIVRSARSYDTGLLVRFPDRAALDGYQKNPQHVTVAELGSSLSEHIVAADFMD